MSKGWIGVDLDGTLAHYTGWIADGGIGEPIPAMVERVRRWIIEGRDVRIFTARVTATDEEFRHMQITLIHEWCIKHIGRALDITATKDIQMVELWDDRCKQVIPNTGLSIEEHSPRLLPYLGPWCCENGKAKEEIICKECEERWGAIP